ncbi:MAG: hypothetical protein U0Y10_06045 [Spirosomataceae bacterium]
METTLPFTIPLTFRQIVELVKQLPTSERIALIELIQHEILQPDTIQTHLASEDRLASDWLSIEEEKAWQHL